MYIHTRVLDCELIVMLYSMTDLYAATCWTICRPCAVSTTCSSVRKWCTTRLLRTYTRVHVYPYARTWLRIDRYVVFNDRSVRSYMMDYLSPKCCSTTCSSVRKWCTTRLLRTFTHVHVYPYARTWLRIDRYVVLNDKCWTTCRPCAIGFPFFPCVNGVQRGCCVRQNAGHQYNITWHTWLSC